ncbi:MAG: [FeFe] hydrogenase, group A [Clostridiales bacterium]|nr:[FeFe] hydrogenase, group A [Clostridiales bacterium]
MTNEVTLTINGQSVTVPAGTTILKAAERLHIHIPTLCYHPDQEVKANCRMCVVEIEGQRLLQAACSYPVAEGMVVRTNTPKLIHVRRNILELIYSHHPLKCISCQRNGTCELQDVAAELNMQRSLMLKVESRGMDKDKSSPSIIRDPNKCILCGRCVEVCQDVQRVRAIAKENRGYKTVVVPPYGKALIDSTCVNCGQCVQVCPVGALTVHDDTMAIYGAIDAGKILAVQVAPSVRTTIAEALGEEVGTVSTFRLVTALKQLGFTYVFDSDFSADLTIMEEGSELLNRMNTGGTLPLFTSCCPAWVKFCETFFPKELPNLSSAKSPQQMFGAVIKTYFAKKRGIDPANIFSVSVMPCTAKKYECQRPEFHDSGYQDVDCSITVQELSRMIRTAGIDFATLPETPFDSPFGLGSGAGEIFAATGGVMEAALRTVYEVYTGKTLETLEFHAVRGLDGIKEAVIDLDGTSVKVAVVHSLGKAREFMERYEAGEFRDYAFVEFMACPGGCIGGGGNPIRTWDKVKKRTEAVYQQDSEQLPVRKSHEQEGIKQIYREFLDKPLSEKSEELLHTTYVSRADLIRC